MLDNKKSTTTIADRGIKYNINAARDEAKNWRNFAFSSLGVTALSLGLTFYFSFNTKFFILDNKEAPIELTQVDKLPFTKSRVATFADEAVVKIYGLNFRIMNEQLESAKKYVSDASYSKIMEELKRSNYLTLIKEKKAIIAMAPTPTVYKFQMLSADDVLIWRSFVKEEIIGSNISREEITYRIKVKRVIPDDLYPWGLYIESISEEESKSF